MFFLTALYHPDIYQQLSDNENEREEIQQLLIQRAEDLIRSYADQENGDSGSGHSLDPTKILQYWHIEKQLVQDLHGIVKKSKNSSPICTAQFAHTFGKSAEMLSVIQENKNCFSDTAHYLKSGGYYSRVGIALLHLETGEYEAAMSSFSTVWSDADDSEFTKYCKERIYFGYGMYALENEDSRFAKYFETGAALIEKFPDYEKDLVEKALGTHDMEMMRRYEDALNQIHMVAATPEIRKTLSLVMTRRCIDMYNARQINFKNLASSLKNALSLDSENELARGTMVRLKMDMELEELNKAIDRLKMNKACQIASKSEFPEVREEFFEFMGASLEHLLDEPDMDDTQRLILLHDFSKWCARVDENHALLYEIDEEIRDLEGKKNESL
jgi:hypothetical protein